MLPTVLILYLPPKYILKTGTEDSLYSTSTWSTASDWPDVTVATAMLDTFWLLT